MNNFSLLFNHRLFFTTALLALLLLSNSSSVFAASLTSTVNRNTMSTNETLTLKVTYDERADSSDLDLSTLRNDFEILSVSPRNSASISTINGKTTRITTTQWTITLAAKRAGKLNIPAFQIKQAQSNAININAVNSGGISSDTQLDPLIASASANKLSIYPNEQLIFEIELSAAATVSDINGTALESSNASIEIINQEQFQRIENGIARNIITLKYAVFAEQSGNLTIPTLNYTGLVGGRRSLFGNQGKQVVGSTKPIAIDVKAPPKGNNTPWFPAKGVSINSNWSGDINAIKTGEPITRTITVTANGQLATAIPPLTHPSAANSAIKSYKDKPQLNSQKTNGGYISTRTESEAIVVNTAGDIELPAITVDWFNVNTEQWQQATLAAETIKVTGSTISSSTPVIASAPSNSESTASYGIRTKAHWVWPVLTGILSLICLLQFWLLTRKRNTPTRQTIDTKKAETEKQLWKILLSDFKNDDPKKIRNSLVSWARNTHPNLGANNLNQIFSQADASIKQNIEKLDSLLFNDNSGHELNEFKNELEQQLKVYRDSLTKSGKQSVNRLEPLYSNG